LNGGGIIGGGGQVGGFPPGVVCESLFEISDLVAEDIVCDFCSLSPMLTPADFSNPNVVSVQCFSVITDITARDFRWYSVPLDCTFVSGYATFFGEFEYAGFDSNGNFLEAITTEEQCAKQRCRYYLGARPLSFSISQMIPLLVECGMTLQSVEKKTF
jgi:hypothetical protein